MFVGDVDIEMFSLGVPYRFVFRGFALAGALLDCLLAGCLKACLGCAVFDGCVFPVSVLWVC